MNYILILTTLKASQTSSFSEHLLYFIYSSYVVLKLIKFSVVYECEAFEQEPRVTVDVLSVKLFNQINIIYKF